jgi:hypothetical protein
VSSQNGFAKASGQYGNVTVASVKIAMPASIRADAIESGSQRERQASSCAAIGGRRKGRAIVM